MDSNRRASLSFLRLWASKSVCSFDLVCGCYLVFEDLEDFCEVEDFLFFFKSFKRKVRSNESCSSIRCSFGWKVFFSGAYQSCNFFICALKSSRWIFAALVNTNIILFAGSMAAWRRNMWNYFKQDTQRDGHSELASKADIALEDFHSLFVKAGEESFSWNLTGLCGSDIQMPRLSFLLSAEFGASSS